MQPSLPEGVRYPSVLPPFESEGPFDSVRPAGVEVLGENPELYARVPVGRSYLTETVLVEHLVV